MKFNLTIDKRAEAEIEGNLCMNCGKCSDICPTDAIEEYRKTVYCMFPDCREGSGKEPVIKSFEDACRFAVESGCTTGCPLGIVPQALAELVKKGEIQSAYELMHEKNPMPGVCAALCDQGCSDYCKRGIIVDAPINIKALEGYILSKAELKPYKHIKRFDERVAVIGGGPAGLTAAFELSKAGYEVTIFEKDSRLGGELNWRVPGFRLDKQQLQGEIDRILAAGINVRYNNNIGEQYTLDDIRNEGFSACLLAVGMSEGVSPSLPGADADMVYDGVNLMRQINGGESEGIELGDDILVIGSGELAADAARVLKRLDKNVTCAAMDRDDNLQMSEASRTALQEEGIELKTFIGPKQIISEDNKVKAVEFIKVEYAEDETGRFRPHGVAGSEFNIFCDTVVFAIGQRCGAENIVNAETYPNGKIKIDGHYKTNKEMLFACGGSISENCSVAEAMASGRMAAAEIDKALHGADKPEKRHAVVNDSEMSIIYPENVQKLNPQFESVIKQGSHNGSGKFSEDILPVLRAAGIEENMPQFTHKDEDGNPKRKAAVIGGGIAGITAAIDLAKLGYDPTIFEKYPSLGGSYKWLASRKRIDKDLLDMELAKVEASGIEVICNVNAGVKPNVQQLLDMGYEAVLFAIGESRGGKPEVENIHSRGVFETVSLMGKLMGSEAVAEIGQQVVVAGCDELTFDTARLLKESCSQVTILAPFGKGKLKAGVASVAAALDEGVHLVTGVDIVSITQTDGKVDGVNCIITEKNITIDIPCDTLVLGDMQMPDTHSIAINNKGLDIDENGYIQVDERLITSAYGVFATGNFDMSSTDAGHAGAAAVRSFMESLDFAANGKPVNDGEKLSGAAIKYEIFEGCISGATGLETGRRLFDDIQADVEASRCLGCGHHKTIGEKCMGCGICAAVCPANAITMKAVKDENAIETAEAGGEEEQA